MRQRGTTREKEKEQREFPRVFGDATLVGSRHGETPGTLDNIMELFRRSCGSRCARRCKIMRLFFRSASRLFAANHSCALFFHARCSSANVLLPCRIVTVKRGCYDRHRAPFCGFSRERRESRARETDLFLSLFPSTSSSFLVLPRSPLEASDHAYLAFNGRRKLHLPPLALFRQPHGWTDATVTGKEAAIEITRER